MGNTHGIFNFIEDNRDKDVKIFLENQEEPISIAPNDGIDWQYQSYIYIQKNNEGHNKKIFINADKIVKVECSK